MKHAIMLSLILGLFAAQLHADSGSTTRSTAADDDAFVASMTQLLRESLDRQRAGFMKIAPDKDQIAALDQVIETRMGGVVAIRKALSQTGFSRKDAMEAGNNAANLTDDIGKILRPRQYLTYIADFLSVGGMPGKNYAIRVMLAKIAESCLELDLDDDTAAEVSRVLVEYDRKAKASFQRIVAKKFDEAEIERLGDAFSEEFNARLKQTLSPRQFETLTAAIGKMPRAAKQN